MAAILMIDDEQAILELVKNGLRKDGHFVTTYTSAAQVPIWSMERRIMITVTKKDLIALGYGTSFSADIIRKAKKLMIEKGHTYYQSRKLDRVPKEAVEELLGITLSDTND